MRSAPYNKVQWRREIANRCERWSDSLDPGGESLLTVANVPWGRPRRLEKYADKEKLGVCQYPSHLTQGSGGKI